MGEVDFLPDGDADSRRESGALDDEAESLDAHADWLLALVASEADVTLAEIEVRLLEERQFNTTDSSISRFFQRHGVTYKETLHASE